MIDGAEVYRAEPGSVRNAGGQTNIFPVDGGRRSQLKSWRVHVKDRLQVAICDDSDIFGRQRSTKLVKAPFEHLVIKSPYLRL